MRLMCPEKGAERPCNNEEKKQHPQKKEDARTQAGIKNRVLHIAAANPGDSLAENH